MKILVLRGDGIGPKITAATLAVFDRANSAVQAGLEWQHEEIGLPALKRKGTTLPARVLRAARRFGRRDPRARSRLTELPGREKGGINPSRNSAPSSISTPTSVRQNRGSESGSPASPSIW